MTEKHPAIRVMMMPRDTNPNGTIFGGVILSYLDQAGAEGAKRVGAERIVTVAMKEVIFHEPVFVGDLVSFYDRVIRIGRSSVTVEVSVEASRRWNREESVQVTRAEITYVNINPEGQPVPLRNPGKADIED